MKNIFLFTMIFSLTIIGCHRQGKVSQIEESIPIYVVSQGWHTGLIIPTNCLGDSIWPGTHNYSKYTNVIIGWGDADYYQNKNFNLWYATKAALWPTSSTLHIKAFNEINEIDPLVNEKVELLIDRDNFNNLCRFLKKQFQLNNQDQLIPQGVGFYSNSQFFESNKEYTAINNSNVWTAKALKEAGFDLNPYSYLTQKSVIRKAKRLSKEVKKG